MTDSPTHPVVTLFESYGSGATQVAPRVAAALGVPYLGQRFSSEELEDAEEQRRQQQADEGPVSRFFASFGHFGVDNRSIPLDQRDEYVIAVENTKTVRDAVAEGGVVLGRNATVILSDNPAALHVKLDAPVEARIARAADEGGIDQGRAARRQAHEDKMRADMSMRLYAWDPRLPDHYDLIVNTSTLDVDQIVDIVVAASSIKARTVAAH
ncbi:MAG: cytidylate kinase-like family protein [Dermatophilaceae bacterium]